MRVAETSARELGASGRVVQRPTGMPASDSAGVAACVPAFAFAFALIYVLACVVVVAGCEWDG
jgi:hypothetical protein